MSAEEQTDILPEIDRDFLDEKGCTYDAAKCGGETHVLIHDFDFPEAYLPRKADLLIILPAGYPNSHPDVFWTYPAVKRTNDNFRSYLAAVRHDIGKGL